MDDNISSIQETLLTPSPKQQEKLGALKGRFFQESKKIWMWRVATPSIIAKMSSFGTIVITQSSVGHISSVDLAAYALVQTLSVPFISGILGIWMGLTCGVLTDTFAVSFLIWRTDWDRERWNLEKSDDIDEDKLMQEI